MSLSGEEIVTLAIFKTLRTISLVFFIKLSFFFLLRWVKAKGPLYSYRKTIKKHLKDDEADVNYEKDLILHIREWVKENTFEKKKDFPEFNCTT